MAHDLAPETLAAIDRLLRLQLGTMQQYVEDRLAEIVAEGSSEAVAGLAVHSELGQVVEAAQGLEVVGARVERDHRTGRARITLDRFDTTTLMISIASGRVGARGQGIITYDGVIESWYVFSAPKERTISATLLIRQASFDDYPTMIEISGLAAFRPAIVTSVKGESADLSGWTNVAVVARDVIEAQVVTASTSPADELRLALTIRRETRLK